MSNEAYEKRSYGSLAILIGYMLLSVFVLVTNFAETLSDDVLSKIMYANIALVLLIMSYIIYAKDRIYWINSFSYKKAANMDPELRHEIAKLFFSVFGRACAIVLLYMPAGILLGTPMIMDTAVFLLMILGGSGYLYWKMLKLLKQENGQ